MNDHTSAPAGGVRLDLVNGFTLSLVPDPLRHGYSVAAWVPNTSMHSFPDGRRERTVYDLADFVLVAKEISRLRRAV